MIIETVNSKDIEQKIQDVIIEKMTENEQYDKKVITNIENRNERDVRIN